MRRGKTRTLGRKMEDPVRFDVYGYVVPEASAAAARALISHGAYASELEARAAAARGKHGSSPALIASHISWGTAQALRASSGPFRDIVVLQEGYSPADSTNFCSVHGLHYGGILGCHVCSGFYVA